MGRPLMGDGGRPAWPFALIGAVALREGASVLRANWARRILSGLPHTAGHSAQRSPLLRRKSFADRRALTDLQSPPNRTAPLLASPRAEISARSWARPTTFRADCGRRTRVPR